MADVRMLVGAGEFKDREFTVPDKIPFIYKVGRGVKVVTVTESSRSNGVVTVREVN